MTASAPAAPRSDSFIDELFDDARRAYPGTELARDAFARHVVECVPVASRSALASKPLERGRELYLAAACLAGDARAIAAFDSLMTRAAAGVLARMGLSESARDDVLQVLRVRFLVGDEGGVAKLGAYTGRGSLVAWVRASAVRQALNVLQRGRGSRDAVGDDEWLALPTFDDDPETAALKQRSRAAFRMALDEALAGLTPKDRVLLRQHIIDGLTITELGVVYGVHPTTVFRRIRQAKEALLSGVKARLHAAIRGPRIEVESFLRMVESSFDMSLRRVLGGSDGPTER